MNFLCRFLEGTIGGNQLKWMVFQAIVLSAFILAFIFLKRKEKETVLSKTALLFLIFVTLLLCRLPSLVRFECNTDESQWIAQANNFAVSPLLWMKYFFLTNYSRSLTIWPLSVFGFFHLMDSYTDARLLSVILISLGTFFYYRSMLNLFGKKTAFFSTAALVLVFSLTNEDEFIAYNSETPAVMLLVFSFYLLLRLIRVPGSKWNAFLLGFFLCLSPFAKEQVVIIAVMFEFAVLVYLFTQKNKSAIIYTILGSITAAVIILSPIVLFNSTDIYTQLQIMVDYANVGLTPTHLSFLGRIKFFIGEYFACKELFFLVLAAAIAFPVTLLGYRQLEFTQRRVFILLMFLLPVTIYSLYLPGNFFIHYGVLLYFPCAVLMGFAMNAVISIIPKYHVLLLAGAFISIFFAKKYFPDRNISELANSCNGQYKNRWTAEITRYTKPGDRLLIWGWNNSYYVEAGLLPGCIYLYPQFVLGSYKRKNDVLNKYAEDLRFLEPRIILEIAGYNNYMYIDPETQRIRNFPVLNDYVIQHYKQVKQLNNEYLYVRQD